MKPARYPNFLHANDSSYGGPLSFNLALDMEKAGIAFANHRLTIFTLAHLHNILQKTDLTQAK